MFILTIFLTLLVACHCKVEISDRASNFSVELLYFTAEETQWHTIISPLGVWSLLCAVSTGTTGDSQRQLRRGLFLPLTTNTFLSEYNTFMEDVIKSVTFGVALKTENYLFVDKQLEVKKEFQNILKNDFQVNVGRLPFDIPVRAADIANTVIKYSGVIEYDVFEPGDFDDAKMILTNLMSFTGEWQSPFNTSKTHVEQFYDEDGKVTGQVNMMEQKGHFRFSNFAQINASVLRLPYGEDENFSFLVILPYSDIKLNSVYTALTTFRLKDILRKLNRSYEKYGPSSVKVKMPRFKISTNFIMNKPLQSMGVYNIFDPGVRSFSSISDSSELYVSAIVHKAEISVTEYGTTASASSSAYFERRALPSTFNANRPFLYFIMKDSTATTIFSGVYSKPTLF